MTYEVWKNRLGGRSNTPEKGPVETQVLDFCSFKTLSKLWTSRLSWDLSVRKRTDDLEKGWHQSMRSCIVVLIRVEKGGQLNNMMYEVAHTPGIGIFTQIPFLRIFVGNKNCIWFCNRCPMLWQEMVTMEEQGRWQRLSHRQVVVTLIIFLIYQGLFDTP